MSHSEEEVSEKSFISKLLDKMKAFRAKKPFCTDPKPYMNPYYAGIGVGIVLFLGFFLAGKGLGASGFFTRLLAVGMNTVAPEHTSHVPYMYKYLQSSTHALDNWLVYLGLGTIIGGLISGMLGRRMKPETFKGPNISNKKRYIFALLGGTLVAWGARLAGGCASGLALTGGATLGLAGWIFFIAIFVSGFIVAYFARKLWL